MIMRDCWIRIWKFVCTVFLLYLLFIDLFASLGCVICTSYVLMCILNMSSCLMSGRPDNDDLFPSTTKNWHVICLFLCLICTSHIPTCAMLALLYVLIWCSFLCFIFNYSTVVLGNMFQNGLDGVILPSQPVFILYAILHILWLILISSFWIIYWS